MQFHFEQISAVFLIKMKILLLWYLYFIIFLIVFSCDICSLSGAFKPPLKDNECIGE